MAAGQDSHHDFAPAWLKLPSQDALVCSSLCRENYSVCMCLNDRIALYMIVIDFDEYDKYCSSLNISMLIEVTAINHCC